MILVGDSLNELRRLDTGIAHTCVTSPPYWGLRDYGVEGQLGHEKTPEEYVAKMVDVFREVRRVLRDDGTLWLNLGDSYEVSKNRALMPARVALALRADGWLLRDEIVWHKPAVMPFPATDRTVPCHEFFHLFAKQKKYFFDHKAVREPGAAATAARYKYGFGGSKNEQLKKLNGTAMVGERSFDGLRNKRSVWTVTPDRSGVAHCAPFPQALIEPCVLAGSPVGGVVLDPFFGAGTTGLVAAKHGRRYIGIELNPEYAALAQERIQEACP